jgi:hypothetical protein
MRYAARVLLDARKLAAVQTREMSRLASGSGETLHYVERLKLLQSNMADLDAALENIFPCQCQCPAQKGAEDKERKEGASENTEA